MKRPSAFHVVCSWCGKVVAQEGEQARLFETPDRTTHTICEDCYAKAVSPVTAE